MRLEHRLSADETDTKLLGSYTPETYRGSYPPYINLAMIRMKGDVVLSVRLPTIVNAPAGAVASVRFTRDMWREFVKMIEPANKVWDACDQLDSIL